MFILLQNIQYLREQITQLLEDPVCHEHACTAYELLMREHYKEIPLEHWLSIWVRPALVQMKRVPIDKTPVYQRILCRAFQINQAILRDLFPNKYMGSHREWGVLLKCLCYARNSKNTLKIGTYDSNVYWWGLIEKTKLKMFAVQRDDVVRVSALRVIVECQRTTEYFTEWEFNYLIEYYVFNGSNQVPHVRKEITSLYKKGITRFLQVLK
ncbi:hypothetical protein HHI36_012528 [Cryptolaemus montrouzieri]|uniref:tRNA (32-2'-O)-methyltransferase regulator THADA-like TPR repeats region domain-containing protein n=1 Tax=Cryptolaemus montrouzieri TaxID=559131 RepID=A0ABD2NER2_9CUCU